MSCGSQKILTKHKSSKKCPNYKKNCEKIKDTLEPVEVSGESKEPMCTSATEGAACSTVAKVAACSSISIKLND